MSVETIDRLQIDVFGPCNLRCPTCLIGCGDSQESRRASKGLMSKETLAAIVEKAKLEMPALRIVTLHNWTEPLLHPQIPELVDIVKDRELAVYISSNLNVLRREDDLLSSGLDQLTVSVSGFHQSTYGRFHASGDIAKVKANMEKLAIARDRTSSKTDLVVSFHRYRNNADEERMMDAFATSLGFRFVPVWAFFTPVEKILASTNSDQVYDGVPFTDADRDVANALAIRIPERLEAAQASDLQDCLLQTQQMPIDVNGNVILCCGAGFKPNHKVGNFLEADLKEIQKARLTHDLCADCGACGIPSYYYGIPNETLDALGEQGRTEAQEAELAEAAMG
jgi:MoaA/NifB/PqqE/SkfB family radical SAM enzyme